MTPREAMGSSPRVRGKLAPLYYRRSLWGLIPACAGKTGSRSSSRSSTGAHPRVCGENKAAALRPSTRRGSSPRVRGKLAREDGPGSGPRLIPACAGKTSVLPLKNWQDMAHPRVCGENDDTGGETRVTPGSSPRVRGKHDTAAWLRGRHGLIPACAGKTAESRPQPSRPRAHPRVCGENRFSAGRSVPGSGSSPRVRGKRGWSAVTRYGRRLIPACAGKTNQKVRNSPDL